MERWKQRYQNYKDALATLEEVVPHFDQLSELEKDGVIQRFSFTVDLAWKVMQDYLAYAGYTDIRGPRACIMQMAADKLVDGSIWGQIVTTRNELAHIYDEEKSRLYLGRIVGEFVAAFRSFKEKMDQLC